jgi:ligand-binding SRPBCC domain-containing protein
MRIHRLQTLQRLPISIEAAWEFFSSPKNLRLITPHRLDFRMTNEPPEEIHPGTIIGYQIRPFPLLPVQWITEITHIRKPNFFVDEQRFGPFKFWHHEHHFRSHMGGVEIEDIIQYGLYLGPIGTFVHDLIVRKQLHDIFTFRAQVLEQRFGRFESGESRSAEPRRQKPAVPKHPPQGPITLKDIYGE